MCDDRPFSQKTILNWRQKILFYQTKDNFPIIYVCNKNDIIKGNKEINVPLPGENERIVVMSTKTGENITLPWVYLTLLFSV